MFLIKDWSGHFIKTSHSIWSVFFLTTTCSNRTWRHILYSPGEVTTHLINHKGSQPEVKRLGGISQEWPPSFAGEISLSSNQLGICNLRAAPERFSLFLLSEVMNCKLMQQPFCFQLLISCMLRYTILQTEDWSSSHWKFNLSIVKQ